MATPNYATACLSDRYHRALVDWQEKNFPEIRLLQDHWSEYFPRVTPFALLAKVGPLRAERIEIGEFAGQPRLERAGEMRGNMFYQARDIIKAQASTEFGSIQQHRMTLEGGISKQAQFAVLRIMAEELRHAYQMFWVLDQDPTWKKLGHGDVAKETMEELLAMETGDHVLDAFNIEFVHFLDSLVFAALIDLVGKYQLEMQRVFSYAPVARSMAPMLVEEAFHLGSGKTLLKEVAVKAALGQGDYTPAEIQGSLNEWFPRGLEMFGNELGGNTAMAFGFKDKTNAQAQDEYIREVEQLMDWINLAIIEAREPALNAEQRRELLAGAKAGATWHGIGPEDLLVVPDRKFFRRRGLTDYVYQPYDVHGRLLQDESGRPYPPERYAAYLETVLPSKYFRTRDWQRYRARLQSHQPVSHSERLFA